MDRKVIITQSKVNTSRICFQRVSQIAASSFRATASFAWQNLLCQI